MEYFCRFVAAAPLRTRLSRWQRSENGSSTVQQAILIALIVGGAFLALDGLGFVAHKTFSTASTEALGGGHLSSAGSGSPGTHSAKSANHPAASAPKPPAPVLGPLALRLIILLVACPLGALCWYLLNRKEKKQEADEEELIPVVPQTDSQIERDLVFDKRHNLLRLFNADIGMLMTSRIMVKHVMSEKVVTVLPNTPTDEVQEIMRSKKIRHVLVCDKRNRLVGLITVRALEDASGQTAAEVMEQDPPTVAPTSLLNPAITQLIKQRLYCLPVVGSDGLVGVLTSTDVMLALQCTLHSLQKTANEVVADLPTGMVPGFMLALGAQESDGSAGNLQEHAAG